MASPNDDRREGAPSHIHIEKKKGFNWLPWLLLALGVLALLFALSRCGRNEQAAVAPVASCRSRRHDAKRGQIGFSGRDLGARQLPCWC
jgi:hypothetical protein